jgi:hypothetical protein
MRTHCLGGSIQLESPWAGMRKRSDPQRGQSVQWEGTHMRGIVQRRDCVRGQVVMIQQPGLLWTGSRN